MLVVTVRALKHHGGGPPVTLGKPLPFQYIDEDIPLLTAGFCNMKAHIDNMRNVFGIPVVVAVNQFPTDTPAELEALRAGAISCGAADAVVCSHWADGGAGILGLANRLISITESPDKSTFKFAYDLDMTIKQKIEALAIRTYGAAGVQYSPAAEEQLARYEAKGFGKLPICMAKTHLSLSHDPNLKGRPTGMQHVWLS